MRNVPSITMEWKLWESTNCTPLSLRPSTTCFSVTCMNKVVLIPTLTFDRQSQSSCHFQWASAAPHSATRRKHPPPLHWRSPLFCTIDMFLISDRNLATNVLSTGFYVIRPHLANAKRVCSTAHPCLLPLSFPESNSTMLQKCSPEFQNIQLVTQKASLKLKKTTILRTLDTIVEERTSL